MATLTPRSLLWLLATTSDQPALLAQLCALPPTDVDHEAEHTLLDQLQIAWARGWQPIELHRQGYRGCTTKTAGKLIALAIAVDHAARRVAGVDPSWRAQVESLQLPTATGGDGWLTGFISHERLDRATAMRAVVDAVRNLAHIPPLRPLHNTASATADPILTKIRALLAKAEATTFEAEALAFTAKAQELMTKHAIHAAALAGTTRAANGPNVIRVPIDSPYSSAKATLLAVVARASRCRTVHLGGCDLSEVIGMPPDLAAVELLFTSLLVQAQTALTQASGSTRAFRSSFLLAYAIRIGERLREVNDSVMSTATVEHGEGFLPVLRSQAERIDDFIDERYGKLRTVRTSGPTDAAGWAGGRAAADQAKLAHGDLGKAGNRTFASGPVRPIATR
jgi:hypothetical protein